MKNLGLTPWIILVYFLLVALCTSGQTSARLKAIEYIQEGDMYLQNRDWEQALFAYTNAIQADVSFAEAYMKRGQLYERTTHTQEASLDYNMAIQLNPFIDIYYDQRARIRLLSFDYYGAMNDISAALEINPSNHDYLSYKIDGLISIGSYEQALAQLDSLNPSEQDVAHFLQRKALIYLLNEDLISAENTIEQAYRQNDSSYLTLDLYGLIYLKKQDYWEAIQWFNKAIAIDSVQYVSFYNRGIAYRYLGEEELALGDINQAIALNSDNQYAYYKRALIKKEQGDFSGAILDYDSAIEIDSTYSDAIYNRSFAYKVLGDYSNASKDIDFVIDLPDNRPEYWNMKGNLLILHGDPREAIACFDQALSYDMNYAEAYYNRGIANLLAHRPLQGCEDFERSNALGYERADEIFSNFCGN